MKGIKKEIEEIANGFGCAIKNLETIIVEPGKLDQGYMLFVKIIIEHSTALLAEINALKYHVRSLGSFKKLNELASPIDEDWEYSEWIPIMEQISIDWGCDHFEEEDIDYSIADSVDTLPTFEANFDKDIDDIKPII